jgi:hypothetical protein
MLTDGHGASGTEFKGGGGRHGGLGGWSPNAGEILALLGIFACCGLAVMLIHAWISLGVANVVEKTRNEGRAGFGALFDARGRFFEMVLGHILMILIVLGTIVPLVLIGLGVWFANDQRVVEDGWAAFIAVIAGIAYLPVWIWLLLGISLYRPAIAIEGLGPTAAIQRSWELVRGHRLRLLLYWVAISIFSMLGLCLCCVGVLLTGPMSEISQFESYLELVQPVRRYDAPASGGPFDATTAPQVDPAVPAEPPPPAV